MHSRVALFSVTPGFVCLVAMALSGCEKPPEAAPPARLKPRVQLIKPELRNDRAHGLSTSIRQCL